MSHQLSTLYRVFAWGYLVTTVCATLAFSGVLVYALASGQALSETSSLLRDTVALALVIVALAAAGSVMLADLRRGLPVSVFVHRVRPMPWTMDVFVTLRPAMKVWLICAVILVLMWFLPS
jgi:hypothetical protein